MTEPSHSSGRSHFVKAFGLDTPAYIDGCRRIVETIREKGLKTLRLSFADQHGILRGKSFPARDAESLFETGCAMTSTLLLKDTSHRTVFPVWSGQPVLGTNELSGAADIMMVPDPKTFRVLPWLKNTGWVLCDLYDLSGNALNLSSRFQACRALESLADAGFEYKSGLEVEFHIFRLEDSKLEPRYSTHPSAPPEVSLITHGYQYLTESRADELEPITETIRENLEALELPLRSIEVEFGPSQVEFTFHPETGLGTADNMILFRSAVKQICQRNGYHASFMCRPHLENLFSCGWHLHQSLINLENSDNCLVPVDEQELLSPTGQQFVAGLLTHASANCVFTTPTINGYKRYRPYTLAPDHITWSRDNKGAMLRIISAPGDPASRIENRVGEPAANPYLYLASQIHAGLDGIKRCLAPGSPTDAAYDSDAERLPPTLNDALTELSKNTALIEAFGETFIQYITTIKKAEWNRFMAEVTDWEQREYFGF